MLIAWSKIKFNVNILWALVAETDLNTHEMSLVTKIAEIRSREGVLLNCDNGKHLSNKKVALCQVFLLLILE